MRYVKGKGNCSADALSCHPTLASAPEESDEAEDAAAWAAMVSIVAKAAEDDTEHVVDLWRVEEKPLRMRLPAAS